MFIVILFVSAMAIAGVAGFFSIYGLANIYTAAFWSVVVMGAVLEVGKLVAASFLQRYWASTGLLLKSYLIIAIVGLMIITSAGIFGYLSNAYQQDSIAFNDVNSRIELLLSEEQQLKSRIQEINTDIGRVGENYVRARIKLMDSYKEESNTINQRLTAIQIEKREITSKQLEIEAHTGPIIYIARAMGKTVDDAITWMTLLIIVVFDPLAIALTLAGNHALMRSSNTSTTLPPTTPPPNTPSPPPPPIKKEEDNIVEEGDVDINEQSINDFIESRKEVPEVKNEIEVPEVLDEPTPNIDTEEKLNKIFETPTEFKTPPSPRRQIHMGDQSNFLRKTLTTNKTR